MERELVSTIPLRVESAWSNLLASAAWNDIVVGLFKFELWGRMGWLDVKRRYRRTILGPFWNVAMLTIYVLAVGIVGAGLFQQNIHEYLPYLMSGMIGWTLISTVILESCSLFVVGHALFRNVRFEYSTLAYALVWRNLIVYIHNLAAYFAIALLLNPRLIGVTALLAVPGLLIVLVNGVW